MPCITLFCLYFCFCLCIAFHSLSSEWLDRYSVTADENGAQKMRNNYGAIQLLIYKILQ